MVVDISEFIWNLRRLIRDGFPKGLPLSELELQYKTHFHWFQTPNPNAVAPGYWTWTQVFKNVGRFKEWFRVTKRKTILVLPKTEKDLKVYYRLNCYTQYIAIRQGGKIEEWSMSESEGDDDEGSGVPGFCSNFGQPLGDDSDLDQDESAATVQELPLAVAKAKSPRGCKRKRGRGRRKLRRLSSTESDSEVENCGDVELADHEDDTESRLSAPEPQPTPSASVEVIQGDEECGDYFTIEELSSVSSEYASDIARDAGQLGRLPDLEDISSEVESCSPEEMVKVTDEIARQQIVHLPVEQPHSPSPSQSVDMEIESNHSSYTPPLLLQGPNEPPEVLDPPLPDTRPPAQPPPPPDPPNPKATAATASATSYPQYPVLYQGNNPGRLPLPSCFSFQQQQYNPRFLQFSYPHPGTSAYANQRYDNPLEAALASQTQQTIQSYHPISDGFGYVDETNHVATGAPHPDCTSSTALPKLMDLHPLKSSKHRTESVQDNSAVPQVAKMAAPLTKQVNWRKRCLDLWKEAKKTVESQDLDWTRWLPAYWEIRPRLLQQFYDVGPKLEKVHQSPHQFMADMKATLNYYVLQVGPKDQGWTQAQNLKRILDKLPQIAEEYDEQAPK